MNKFLSEDTICSDTELRKLRVRELCTLGQILNLSDSWKKLMAIVPKDETSDLPKFTSEHFSLIEQAAQQQKRNAAEIFLSEWGTMGKKRPTLGTLLNLLTKVDLLRAADYIAEDILKVEPPKRPTYGPAAPVNISHEDIKRQLEEEEEELHEICTFQLPSNNIDNKDINPRAMDKQMNNSSLERNMQSTKLISIKEKHNKENGEIGLQQKPIEVSSSKEVSDLIKFETEQSLEAVPSVLPLNIPNANNLHPGFGNQEMSSRELPISLREFEQTEQARFNREMLSNELPIFVNNRTNLSNTSLTISKDETSETLYEMTSTELPQCIIELHKNSTTNKDNTSGIKINENIQQNMLSSHELPVVVLEYNK
ncbi:protein Tube isoform X3 [Osmia bicornis bicornis]|uniref:protein Tube isoform X3 n=1 Tax=Osmia bicornis bicornis TaxID=1437191 RepID=UPI001EAEABCC|nr:protein Tube isoform X3 [Osmia bicornis bicornis]